LKPHEPHPTHKFPKVALTAPAGNTLSSPPVVSVDGSAPESVIPGFSGEEDVKTVRGGHVLPAPARPEGPRTALRTVFTMLNGLNAGQVFTIEGGETTIGRGRDADVRIDDIGISRIHARVVRAEDGRHLLEDLQSTNGVFVNGQRVERVALVTGDRVQIGPAVLLRYALVDTEEAALARQLYETSTRDPLTSVYNRRYLTERLTAEVAYAHRHQTRLSVVLIDLDHFKRVNDDYGHLAGDAVLRSVSVAVQRQTRTEDVFARYGGEEFVVVVRGIEHKNVAIFAERLRRAVELLETPWNPSPLRVTVSLGVASLDECEKKAPPDALLSLADERLYRSKAEGRNRASS
jgi:two-component system cell cycle response regulator